MVVVPTANEVELTYGWSTPELAGWGLTAAGLVALVALLLGGLGVASAVTGAAARRALARPSPEPQRQQAEAYEQAADLQATLSRYARHFDLGPIGAQLGYPLFMKPYDGGGWVGVSKVDDEAGLRAAYEASGTKVMHLQSAVIPYEYFVRCIGLGPQTRVVNYDPDAPLHDRYRMDRGFLPAELQAELEDITLTINAFFGWDFNSCEALLRGGQWHPIDFANACPDSQVTSLHYHFPGLIKANLRWAIFCAATRRRVRHNLDWQPYFDIAAQDLPYREKLRRYARIARQTLDADAFEEFCARHLAHLDAVADEFFGTEQARDAVRQKVTALFPAHEVEQFTELFYGRIQRWRAEQAGH
jgi:hypothetical protein